MSLEGISRRECLEYLVKGGGAALLLSACKEGLALEQLLSPPNSTEPSFRMGDVVTFKDRAYLLRESHAYLIPDLERYKRLTKLAEYGRKVMVADNSILTQYPVEELPVSPTQLGVINPFSGELEDPKIFGGEINAFFPGFLTDEGMPFESIYPGKETFVDIRAALKLKNWQATDNLFFTYGKQGQDHYKAVDTAKSPAENINHTREFLLKLKQQFPLAQFNLIGHSLGGIFALEAARSHLDAINNLILINFPIRGIERTPGRVLQTLLVKPVIGKDEQVTAYLFDLWTDKEYQKSLTTFVKYLASVGRKLTIIVSENDPIVPKDSAVVEGAKVILAPKVDSGGLLVDLKAHGSPLKNDQIIDRVAQIIGEKLS